MIFQVLTATNLIALIMEAESSSITSVNIYKAEHPRRQPSSFVELRIRSMQAVFSIVMTYFANFFNETTQQLTD
jgi:hypothetical protein